MILACFQLNANKGLNFQSPVPGWPHNPNIGKYVLTPDQHSNLITIWLAKSMSWCGKANSLQCTMSTKPEVIMGSKGDKKKRKTSLIFMQVCKLYG